MIVYIHRCNNAELILYEAFMQIMASSTSALIGNHGLNPVNVSKSPFSNSTASGTSRKSMIKAMNKTDKKKSMVEIRVVRTTTSNMAGVSTIR